MIDGTTDMALFVNYQNFPKAYVPEVVNYLKLHCPFPMAIWFSSLLLPYRNLVSFGPPQDQ